MGVKGTGQVQKKKKPTPSQLFSSFLTRLWLFFRLQQVSGGRTGPLQHFTLPFLTTYLHTTHGFTAQKHRQVAGPGSREAVFSHSEAQEKN